MCIFLNLSPFSLSPTLAVPVCTENSPHNVTTQCIGFSSLLPHTSASHSTPIGQHLAALVADKVPAGLRLLLDQVTTVASVSSVGVVCDLMVGALTARCVRGLSRGASATRAGELGVFAHAVLLGCCATGWEEAGLAWKTTKGVQTNAGGDTS